MKAKIEKILKDKLIKEILTFFYQNQASIDTVSGISAWDGSDRKEVKAALEKLVGLGILQEDSMGSTKGYCYTRDPKIMKIVRGMMK